MASNSQGRVTNALSIDVEDYFQVSALEEHCPRDAWDRMPCRVERNIKIILELLDEANVEATFFTLGWVAERYPRMVERIARRGHEIASHGYAHHRATDLDRLKFVQDVVRSKKVLEDITGVAVRGYRAPSFSIGRNNLWAFECLSDAGYQYSSSVYPVRHDHYGMREAPRFKFEAHPGFTEVPITTARMLGANLPAGGGGYFRLLPYAVSKWLIDQVNRRERRAAVFYFHPWEVDPEQPRVQGVSAKTRFRHYLNLDRTAPRLRRLLADFAWDRVDRVFLEGTH
jgi:polysaccharide deacetylase family protein (PEP-CTERM system associated)